MNELHETKIHGKPEFPFAVYPCSFEVNQRGTPLHWHEELEIMYIVSGSGWINVQGERLAVGAGDMVLVAPQKVHGIDQDRNNEMTHYALLFRPSMLESGYAQSLKGKGRGLPVYLPRGDRLNGKLAPLILELSLNRKKADSEYALMIMSQLYAIAYHIIHESREPEETESDRHMNYDRLKVVLEYLRENYAREITVEEAASMCGFSASHFMKLFRELTGSSFTQYLKNLRLDTAAEQLRTTEGRVGDIAEAVGFRNLPYFTRAFGCRFHMSPLNYREMTGSSRHADEGNMTFSKDFDRKTAAK